MNNSFSYKSEFLYKAIDDTTNTIRFLDTKAGAVFVGISICLSIIQATANTLLSVFVSFRQVFIIHTLMIILFICYIFCAILSLFFGFKALKPANKEIQTNNTTNFNYTKLWYIPDNKNISLSEYYNRLKPMSRKDCLMTISHELLKLSVIRNVKLKNSNLSISFFIWSLLPLGFIYLIMFVKIFIL